MPEKLQRYNKVKEKNSYRINYKRIKITNYYILWKQNYNLLKKVLIH